MGDHRAHIKITMSAHGRDYKTEMDINWIDDGDGVDRRVIEWLRDSYEDSLEACHDFVTEAHARETERRERAELDRLSKKYAR